VLDGLADEYPDDIVPVERTYQEYPRRATGYYRGGRSRLDYEITARGLLLLILRGNAPARDSVIEQLMPAMCSSIADVTPEPPTHDKSGYLYALELSNGTVKLGMSANPASRIDTHRAAAGTLGLTIRRAWQSHAAYVDGYRAETAALDIAHTMTGTARTYARRENFPRLDFDALTQRLSTL